MNGRVAAVLLLCAAAASCRSGERGDPGREPAAAGSAASTGGLRFVAERVELGLAPGSVEVTGDYTFRSAGPGAWRGRIGYPIWVDAGQPAPERVLQDGGEALPVRCRAPSECAAVVALELEPERERTVRLTYRQPLTGPRATYLVTSAGRWNRPLERAELVVRLPAAWTGVDCSFSPDEDVVAGETRTLRIVREGFAPDRELVVTWQE